MPGFKAEKFITKAAKGEVELEEEDWKPILARLDYSFTAFPGRNMTFETVPLNEEGTRKVLVYIEDKKENLLANHISTTEEIEKQPFVNPDNWQEAENIKIQIDENILDFSQFLPKEARIFFCPMSQAIRTGGAFSHENCIYILGDITNLRGILTALHEIGHLRDYERLERLDKESLVEDGEYTHEAEKLRRERSASAFAINILRPFLKDPILKKDVLAFLKNNALQSYYSGVAERVYSREALKNIYASYAFDEDIYGDEYKIFDDWQKWRNTPAYHKWKSENPNIDKWDEFGSWREWIEQTKYDYYRDIES